MRANASECERMPVPGAAREPPAPNGGAPRAPRVPPRPRFRRASGRCCPRAAPLPPSPPLSWPQTQPGLAARSPNQRRIPGAPRRLKPPLTMVCSSPVPRSPGSGQGSAQPDLLWLAELTGAHLGLAPISQDPEDRCSIWENLVSLVDFQSPGFPLTSEELGHYMDIPRSAASSPGTASVGRAVTPPGHPGDIDYRTNGHVKPPYSYATLICMAMEASQQPKLTLAAICKWISDNFCYFRRAHPSWQSSIRHNLCINKRFVKVPREKGEPGRGAFWKLHPQYAQWLRSSTLKGHRALAEPVPPSRRAQQCPRRAPSPAGTATRGGLEVGAELQRLLREFEEFESSQRWSPAEQRGAQQSQQPWAEAPWVPGCAQACQEAPGELTELKGSTEWEALLDAEPGELCALGQPGAFPLPPGRARGCPQALPEPGPAKPGLDETLMATAFLEAAWHDEMRGSVPGCVPGEQGAANLQGTREIMDWDSLAHLRLY
ncbi:forkhead box protein J1-like [Zonotrichia leucophrys gambelii]|uniref:forkhead box protein J1-like n=1 Tax=Zonotrichia leucophrys gambelii TaxID=257770 RepID=UPI0031408E96